jgi:hypothetical protein
VPSIRPGNPAADYNPRDLAFNPHRPHDTRAASAGRTLATVIGPTSANHRNACFSCSDQADIRSGKFAHRLRRPILSPKIGQRTQ